MTPEEKHEYDQQKNRLQMKVIARNLSETQRADGQKLTDGLKDVPVKKIMDQLQYLENILLPKIETSRGRESQDYQFYASVADSLQWAVLILDRYDRLLMRHHRNQIFSEHVCEQLTHARKELDMYQASEDILLNQSFQSYLRGAAARIQDLKEKK